MASTNVLPDSAGFELHARLIGALPSREEDLFVSVAMGFVFWGLFTAGVYRWQSKRKTGDVIDKPYETSVLLGVSISCFVLGLAYWIRAGLANSDVQDRKRSTYQAEQILFVVPTLMWVDWPALTMTRDEILIEVLEELGLAKERPLRAPKHWLPKFTWAGRVLLVVAGILYVVGIIKLPNPADAQPAFGETTSLRLAGSLIVFLVMLFNIMFLMYGPIKFKITGVRNARLLVLLMNLLVLVTVFYNFVIVAVTDDDSPMIRSKVFFYFAYAFFPGIMVLLCLSLNLRAWTSTGEFPWWHV